MPRQVDRADPLEVRAKLFAAARQALSDNRSDQAARHLAAAEEVLPELADYVLFERGRLAQQAGDTATAKASYDRLLAEHPESVWLGSAAAERGRMAIEEASPADAVAFFDRALAADDPASRDAAQLGKARALAALGAQREAYELVDPLRGRPGATGLEARELGEGLEERGATALGLDAAELRLRTARARLREGRLEEATAPLAPLLEPGRPDRAAALLVVARIRVKQGAAAEASEAFGQVIAASDRPEIAGTALFERGRWLWNRDEDAAAERDFHALVARFGGHEKAPEALYALGRIAEARGELAEAARHYEALAERHPGSEPAREAAWRAGFARYLAGDYAGAARALASLPEDEDAAYWRARALAGAGDGNAARDLLVALGRRAPRSYVAWWVDEEVGSEASGPAAAPAVPVPGDPPPPLSGGPAVGEVGAYHFTRAEILRALGLQRDAAREYAAIEAAQGADPALLDYYRAADAHPAMIRLARRLERQGQAGLELYLYPRAFAAEFDLGAARSGLDALLLTAVARQESLFDPAARSPVGARGVMQLMPTTASQVAGTEVEDASLVAPATNIDLGARHLRALLDRYDGRLIPALAAYNAGPEAVARWEARARGARGDEFVERIGYRETRLYVKAVLRNYRTYRALAGERGAPPLRLY